MHRSAFSQISSSVTCRLLRPQRKTWTFAVWLSFALLPFNVHVIASFQSCCLVSVYKFLLLALPTSLNNIFCFVITLMRWANMRKLAPRLWCGGGWCSGKWGWNKPDWESCKVAFSWSLFVYFLAFFSSTCTRKTNLIVAVQPDTTLIKFTLSSDEI